MNQSSIVAKSAAPACRVINGTPMPPVMAPDNLYPGTGKSGVNTSPGNPKLQVMKDSTAYPPYVLPSGSTL